MKYVDDTLLALCDEYALSQEVRDGLYRQADYLETWQKLILPASLTPKQTASALAKVSNLAMQLAIFIDSLPGDIKFDLSSDYFSDPMGREELQVRLKYSTLTDMGALLAVEGSVLPNIAKSAERVAAERRLRASVNERGRPPIVDQQSHFIGRIAECVRSAGIIPSNGGRFRKLCEAVFEAGSVTFPERALRNFMRNMRPEMKEDGRCL
jgi:hypothetical protein